jgi:hypothetical protein
MQYINISMDDMLSAINLSKEDIALFITDAKIFSIQLKENITSADVAEFIELEMSKNKEFFMVGLMFALVDLANIMSSSETITGKTEYIEIEGDVKPYNKKEKTISGKFGVTAEDIKNFLNNILLITSKEETITEEKLIRILEKEALHNSKTRRIIAILATRVLLLTLEKELEQQK